MSLRPVFRRFFFSRHVWLWGLILLSGLGIAFAPVPALGQTAAPAERRITIEASAFEYTPGIVQVNPGDRVTIDLVATDVVHGLYLDGYDLSISADPGQTASLSFVADRPGTFRFRCSVSCGALHPFMIGKLKVGPNLTYWRAAGLAVLAGLAGYWLIRK